MTERGYKVAQREQTHHSVVETWHNKSWNATNTCAMLTCTLYLLENVNLQSNLMKMVESYNPSSYV